MLYHQLHVELAETYPIYIGTELLANGDLIKQYVAGKQVLIVTNSQVAPFYLEQVQRALAPLQCHAVILPDGEEFKTQTSLNLIYQALIEHNHHRDTTLLALGGGVIGDITGFAAATYQRGVCFLQMPTTLLAQVDAAVGGKTGINFLQAKNMVGCIYQPRAVFIDILTLHTLPLREFRAGLAEVIKYAVLSGKALIECIETTIQTPFTNNHEVWANLITQCCAIKASYVKVDQHDHGPRLLLNLGHTFAHALETITHYKRWLHGEAVAIGLYAAALLSHELGYLNAATLAQIDQLLAIAGLPRRIPSDISLDNLLALMWQDKKIKQQQLRFVLIRQFGDCFICDNIAEATIYRVLNKSMSGEKHGI